MSADTSLRDQAAAGVAWSTVHIWGAHAVQVGVMLVLARVLEPRDFGLFAMSQVVLTLVQAVAGQGIPEALVQADREDPADWSTGLRAVLAGSFAGGVVVAGGAPLLATLFDEAALGPLLVGLAPAVLLAGLHSMFYARARAGLMFAEHARAGIAGAVATFVVGVGTALAGGGVWALVAGLYAGQAVETGLLARATGVIPASMFDRDAYRRLIRYGRHIVGASLTTFLERRSDDYFVGLFLGADVLGLYAVAYRVLELATTVFLRAVERVAFPVFAKLQARPDLLADGVRTSFRFVALVSFPAFAGLAVVASDLMVAALGATWVGAAAPLRALAVSGFALSATLVLPSVIRALNRPQWNVVINGSKGVVLAALFALAAQVNVTAVAWVFSAGVFLTLPVFLAAVKRLVPLDIGGYLAEGAAPLVASVVMVAGLAAVAPALGGWPVGLRLATEVALGVGLYGAAILLVGRRHVHELRERIQSLRR